MQMTSRAATRSDAEVLHALRCRSILQLAPTSMSVARVKEWANKGSVESMRRRLEETDAWVAEEHGEILGWVAVRSDYLDALYVEPARAGQRIGAFLLQLAEEELRQRGLRSSGWTRAGTRKGSTSDMVMSSSGRVRRMTLDPCGSVLALCRPRQRRPDALRPAMRAARSRTAGHLTCPDEMAKGDDASLAAAVR
jgi:GNAT superfamily N-acetyltransferase